MATHTFNFTTSAVWAFTGSAGQTACTAAFDVFGAGGHGGPDGTGGSGGGYAGRGDINAGIIIQSGSIFHICVGQAGVADGGTSSIATSSGYVFVRAPGGKQNGSISHQATLLTGSVTYVGGTGGENYTGYSNYSGGGGGSRADYAANGVAGQSGFYATRLSGAPGGKVPNAMPFYAGSGSFYKAGANTNYIVSAGSGAMGCGGGGGYDYPVGTDSSGAAGNGYATITLYT
jgi:hypothetical protein